MLGLTPGGGWVFVFVLLVRCAERGRADAAAGGASACGYALSYILGVVPP